MLGFFKNKNIMITTTTNKRAVNLENPAFLCVLKKKKFMQMCVCVFFFFCFDLSFVISIIFLILFTTTRISRKLCKGKGGKGDAKASGKKGGHCVIVRRQ